MSEPTEFRLVAGPAADGVWNMAVDEALLSDAAESGVGTIRFYGWTEPTLSLGYFQRYADRRQHVASAVCKCVRRQTGGGAIVHHPDEITYSIAVPPGHRLARQPQELYVKVHDAFIRVLRDLFPEGHTRPRIRRVTEMSTLEPAQEPFLCFERRSVGDVVATPPNPQVLGDRTEQIDQRIGREWKILGSAQRRSRGALLQHGSLHLKKTPVAPELPGFFDITELETDRAAVSLLRNRLQLALKLDFSLSELPPRVESKAHELANSKYGTAAWTKRR